MVMMMLTVIELCGRDITRNLAGLSETQRFNVLIPEIIFLFTFQASQTLFLVTSIREYVAILLKRNQMSESLAVLVIVALG